MKKKPICCEFLLLQIKKSSVKFCAAEIVKRISSQFSCRSVVVVRVGLDSLAYLIGVHTTDASKHTYRKVTRALFPEIEEMDFEAKAIKGIGSWARSLCEKKNQIVLCSGELQTHELFRIESLVKTKKKIAPPEKKKKKIAEKGEKRSRKKDKAMPVIQNRFSFVEKKFSLSGVCFSWSKKILSFCFRLLKEIFWVIFKRVLTWTVGFSLLFYAVFYKKIRDLPPEVLQSLTFEEVIDWLLDWRTPGLPEGHQKVDLFKIATAAFLILFYFWKD
jgi:hypothetical protein